jgi:hypothetical protein
MLQVGTYLVAQAPLEPDKAQLDLGDLLSGLNSKVSLGECGGGQDRRTGGRPQTIIWCYSATATS